jgi:glutathione peroxidase
MESSLYDLTATLNDGSERRLAEYRGKVLLVVNTASRCGFTPQYQGLQALYERRRGEGLEILGFPCNQFGHQEPGSDAEIASFCQLNFGVTFPLFQKVEVNGAGAHPVFRYLTGAAPGLLGESIKWNFTKFLVDRQGRVLHRFAPTTPPEKLESAIVNALGERAGSEAQAGWHA